MSGRNDGGPAFPVHDPGWLEVRTVDEAKRAAAGMSLRDYFAGQAIAGFLRAPLDGFINENEVSQEAYKLADAMLKARES